MSAKKQFTSEETAEARKELTSVINKAIDNAIALTLRSIKNIVPEYSQAKEQHSAIAAKEVAELGISHKQSSTFQKIAAIPDEFSYCYNK